MHSVNTGDDYFIITSNTTYVRTTKEDNVENSQCSFLFEYNDTDIKFIIFDIEKFPLNLKEEEYIENKVNDTNKKENDKIKQSEIKKFEFFLNSFYLPSFNLCLNTFYSNIYIIESLKVKYDRALNILNVETDLLKEELLNSLNRKLLSDRMSLLIFDIFTKFSFGNQALSKKPRYYSLFYSVIQSILKEHFSIKNGNSLYIYERMVLICSYDEKAQQFYEKI
ncbi:hypothetical protein CWI36_0907p0030 [Hamiltosporidium magnivora]|uniref:Uncharacterized protein n=1 Tax=Hamiltosporidium magnivora TaxID=148818 RepID=A0A4Q9L8K4_9MICR|nr:hypothetical protein CWI36_0907p0030 [Hamiltosporidium magnivora]